VEKHKWLRKVKEESGGSVMAMIMGIPENGQDGGFWLL
jgi:hypothetical protein